MTIDWPEAWRVVSRPTSPIAAFSELVDDPSEIDSLLQIESLTNPFVREALGPLASIPDSRRYHGPEAALVMTPFVLPRTSRFSDGAYGVLYAGRTIETALHEVAHYQDLRLRATRAPAGTSVPMFSLSLSVKSNKFFDARRSTGVDPNIYDPDSYAVSQVVGARLRSAAHDGLVYDSVRHPNGECVGIFWPNAIHGAARVSEWRLYYDGAEISEFAKVTS